MKLQPFSAPSPGLFLLGLIGHLVAVSGQSPSISLTDTAIIPFPTTPPPSPPGSGVGETPAGFALNESLGGMAYGMRERKLYIQGGNRSDSTFSTQLYMLDLSVRWDTSNPVWSRLPITNGVNVSGVSGGFLSSGAFVVHSNNPQGLFFYDIPSGSWSNLNGPVAFANGGQQVATATDNRTYFLSDGLVADPQSTPQANIPKQQRLAGGLAAAWSLELKKVVTAVPNGTKLLDARTLDPTAASNVWITLNAKGIQPGKQPADRTSHCLVPVENDPTTFLLYGGRISGASSDELWSLSVTTALWKQLPSSGSARYSMACAVSGDTLVVWGGFNDSGSPGDTTPLLFNLTTNAWGATEFVPIPTKTILTSPTPTGEAKEGSNPGPNVAAIAGGTAGGVVLIALIGFFLYRRRARGRDNKNTSLSRNSMADSGHPAEKEEFIEDDRERSLPNLTPAHPQQQQTLVLPRGGSPTAAPMAYSAAAPMQQPPLPMHSRPMTSHSNTVSVDSRHSGSVPVIHSPFGDASEASAKHPLLTPIQYTPATQHQPRPQENEVVDLMPITRSEAGSLHSRSNSVSSRHSLGRRTTLRTTVGRDEDEDEDEDPEELDYL